MEAVAKLRWIRMDRGRFDAFADEPICKFGPGGDYVRVWPGEASGKGDAVGAVENPLRKVLERLADIIGATVNIASVSGVHVEGPQEVAACEVVNEEREEDHVAADNESGTGNAETIRDTGAHPAVRAEPLLFADNSRAGAGGRRKSNYRIRAHRKTARKRAARKIDGQGTLFEIDCTSQSAA